MKSTPPLHGGSRVSGVIPALITPFTETGAIDFDLFDKHVEYLSCAGVQGLFVNGTTGEGAYLTTAEKRETFQHVKQITHGRQFLCAACLQPSTELVLQEMRQFDALEPDFMVTVTPYYYGASQDVIYQHYVTIAAQSPVPVIVYNIPSRTHNPITLDTIFKLAQVDNIAGVKDSSGDFAVFSRGVYANADPAFAWIQGEDYLDGPAFLVGADGIVTGLGNVWIEPYVAMYEACKSHNSAGIHQAQQQINALYEIIQRVGGKTIPAIKAGAAYFGRSTARMKIPGLGLDPTEIEQVKDVLVKLELL